MIGSQVPVAIRTEALTKRYKGLVAVDNVSLAIPKGSLFGFIGPNGAGKTTTIRMLAGLIAPTSGYVSFFGQPVDATDFGRLHRIVGYMPDFFGVYDDMRSWEYLDFFGRCYGLDADERAGVVADLLELVDLESKRDAEVDSLSRGMKQRLCLAHALVHDPEILLLDEPASGLDPRARIEMRELLRELRNMGKTIIISSHILSELAEMCDEIGIIERGKILSSGSVEAIERELQPRQQVRVQFMAPSEAMFQALESVTEVHLPPADTMPVFEGAPIWMTIEVDGDAAARAGVLQALQRAGIPVTGFVPVERDLENVFLRVTKGAVG